MHVTGARTTPLLVCLSLALCALPSLAAWHDDHPGTGVTVHYVHLTGHGNNAFERQFIADGYQICATIKRVAGEQAPPFSAADVPAFPLAKDVEIYYGTERTAMVSTVRAHVIDKSTCRLTVDVQRAVRIDWASGACNIDLVRKLAYGACNTNSFAGLPTTRPHPVEPATPQTEFRNIAGISCRVHAHAVGPTEHCIAQPVSSSGAFVEPVQTTVSPFNANYTGLALEVRTPWDSLRAQDVRLGMVIGPELFALPPPGVTVNPNARR